MTQKILIGCLAAIIALIGTIIKASSDANIAAIKAATDDAIAKEKIAMQHKILLESKFKDSKRQIQKKDSTARINGIITMGELLAESAGKQWSIVEILSEFIHVKSVARKNLNIKLENRKEAKEEIIAAINILKRRDPNKDNENQKDVSNRIVKLAKSNLYETDFGDAHFPNADFSDSDLTNISFEKADLTGSFFRRSYLTGAGFDQADLTGADLGGADLRGADLSRSKSLLNANLKPTFRTSILRH